MEDLLVDILEKRFGEHRVAAFLPPQHGENTIDLLKIDLEVRFPVTVIMTNGLSAYNMPVPEKKAEHSNVELYFCLPSYWDLDDLSNPNFSWPFALLDRLSNHLLDKSTWYGVGHTFANGNPPQALSEKLKANHLLLTEPILLEEHLQPIVTPDKSIHFLAITPIFEQEFDYKNSKGYFKFMRKYRSKNHNELVDDFRQSCLKSRFRIF